MALHIPKAPGFAQMLKEGARHFLGLEEAVYRNINACKQFAETVRIAYGPNVMNKIIINHIEKLFVTNDAATIIKELEVEHPAAKLMILASEMQEKEIGDGTNFVIIFSGALLEAAEDLLRMIMVLKYKCNYCDRLLSTRSSWRRHIINIYKIKRKNLPPLLTIDEHIMDNKHHEEFECPIIDLTGDSDEEIVDNCGDHSDAASNRQVEPTSHLETTMQVILPDPMPNPCPLLNVIGDSDIEQTSIECVNQGSSSQRYLPLAVAPTRTEPIPNQDMSTLTYPQYLSTVRAQVMYAKEIHDMLLAAAQNIAATE